MPSFDTVRDLKQAALQRAGELTDGTSRYDTLAVKYLNELYHGVIAGGNEFGIDVSEPWVWAESHRPIVLTLTPPYETGSVSMTYGSLAGTFSDAPTASQVGCYLRCDISSTVYRIREHVAGGTSFKIDQPFIEATGSYVFKSMKLEYDLVDDTIVVDQFNTKIDFSETAGIELTATLTQGIFTPTSMCAEIKTQLEAVGAETYTVTFSSITRKFTVAHGGAYFSLLFGSGTNAQISASEPLGFYASDLTGALTYTCPLALNAIQRLSRPMQVHRDTIDYVTAAEDTGKIYSLDLNTMLRKYPLMRISMQVPDKFAIVRQRPNGMLTVLFNAYVDEETRVEVNYIPRPRDLSDNVNSFPLLPLAFRTYLVYGSAFFLLSDKSDNKAQLNYDLAKAKLGAMINDNRKTLSIAGQSYGKLISRKGSDSYRFFTGR